MGELADLLRPAGHTNTPAPTPLVLDATVLDLDPPRVLVPALDGGKTAFRAFGTLQGVDVGDEVRVALDAHGGFVVVGEDGSVPLAPLAVVAALADLVGAHLADSTAVHPASAIEFTPTGSIDADNVQDAIVDAGPTRVRKTADETVNNSAVLQNDDHLALPVSAGEVWAVDMRLLYDGDGSAVALKLGFTVPAGGVFYWATGSTDPTTVVTTGTAPLQVSGVGTIRLGHIRGVYVGGANAGTLQTQWAQFTQHASDMKLRANSHLIASLVS